MNFWDNSPGSASLYCMFDVVDALHCHIDILLLEKPLVLKNWGLKHKDGSLGTGPDVHSSTSVN